MCMHICAKARVWGSSVFFFHLYVGSGGFTPVAKLALQAPFEASHWSWPDLLKRILGIQQRMV